MFEQYENEEILWVRWGIFWSVLENKYKMLHLDIQELLRFILYKKYNVKYSKPMGKDYTSTKELEEAYKNYEKIQNSYL